MSILKAIMAAILVITEVPAMIFLVCSWIRAKREDKMRHMAEGTSFKEIGP